MLRSPVSSKCGVSVLVPLHTRKEVQVSNVEPLWGSPGEREFSEFLASGIVGCDRLPGHSRGDSVGGDRRERLERRVEFGQVVACAQLVRIVLGYPLVVPSRLALPGDRLCVQPSAPAASGCWLEPCLAGGFG